MEDYPNHVFSEDLEEDFTVGVLISVGEPDDCTMQQTQSSGRIRTASGGDVLMSHQTPPSASLGKTAGDVLNNYSSRSSKISSASLKEDASVDEETFIFSADKATNAVKHFVVNEIKKKNQGKTYDVVDARGDQDASSPPFAPPPPPVYPCGHILERQDTTIEDEFCYDMDHSERGCFVIFNVKNFHLYNERHPKEPQMQTRYGTDKDASNLKNAAYRLGFEHVRVVNDPTTIEILSLIQRMAEADHSNYDCFACAILTHGGDGDVLYSSDDKMKLTDFTRPFGADRCVSLAGKPKLFFIQACRGFKLDHGKKIRMSRGGDLVDGAPLNLPTPTKADDRLPKEVSIPAEADFLIANSTVSDYYAWRSESNGSWFIQSLCAIFATFGHKMELMRMMTRINRMVAFDYASSSTNLDMNEKKQIPSIATRLTAEVFFKPKRREEVALRASASPPSALTYYSSRIETHSRFGNYGAAERVTATSTRCEGLLYPMGDSQVSPHNPNAEKFLYPSPQTFTRPHLSSSTTPNLTPSASSSSFRSSTIPFSSTPPSGSLPTSPIFKLNPPHQKLSSSVSAPKFIDPRTSELQQSETYSRSWDAIRGNPSTPVLRTRSPHSRLTEHRCSLPENQLTSINVRKGSIRKDYKQTHL